MKLPDQQKRWGLLTWHVRAQRLARRLKVKYGATQVRFYNSRNSPVGETAWTGFFAAYKQPGSSM